MPNLISFVVILGVGLSQMLGSATLDKSNHQRALSLGGKHMKQHLSQIDKNCTQIEQACNKTEQKHKNQIQRLESEIASLKNWMGGLRECVRSAKLDLQLIVDGSGSIGDNNFAIMLKQIADSLIPQLNIGFNNTRVAFTQFSTQVREEFSLTYSYDKTTLQKKIKDVDYMRKWTYTAKALKETLERFKQQRRHGTDVAGACIVLADGEANDADQLDRATQAWADNDIPVFAIGIGDGIKPEGLLKITGNKPSRVLHVDDFSKIADIIESLLVIVCKDIEETKCKARERQYQREIQELNDKVNGLEQNITNLLSNGSEHTVGILSQYTFVHSRRSWNASQAYCQRMGGNLAVITTLEEERNLMRIIKEKYSWDQAFWIGAKKGEYEVGEWTWLTGETMSLEGPFVWAQENGVYQDGCLVLHPKGFMRKDVKHGGFRGQGCCDDKHAFICETTTVDPICINEKYWDWALWWRRNYSF